MATYATLNKQHVGNTQLWSYLAMWIHGDSFLIDEHIAMYAILIFRYFDPVASYFGEYNYKIILSLDCL